jgi:hypothetical protein
MIIVPSEDALTPQQRWSCEVAAGEDLQLPDRAAPLLRWPPWRVAPPETEPLRVYLDDAARAHEDVVDVVPVHDRPVVEAFLGQPPPPEPGPLVFSHNDLGADMPVDPATGAVTGVIAWSDAGVAHLGWTFAGSAAAQ